MRGKVLLLGDTGKVGTAVQAALGPRATIIGCSTRNLDASDLVAVEKMIDDVRPDFVINGIAYMGVDPCEKAPEMAFRMNTMMPRLLAQKSDQLGYTLVHFSSESVFSGVKRDFHGESDTPDPINIYGLTKYMADLVVQKGCERHFVLRIPTQFGEGGKGSQLLERMIERARRGETLRVADDVITSPTYSADVASVVRAALEGDITYGLYHVTNSGSASLYELVSAALEVLGMRATVERASHKDFPMVAKLHLVTPLRQEKLPALRHWRDALATYCARMQLNYAA
jgi:dTDP-4-dehydrorhamnose reductase